MLCRRGDAPPRMPQGLFYQLVMALRWSGPARLGPFLSSCLHGQGFMAPTTSAASLAPCVLREGVAAGEADDDHLEDG